MTPNQIKKNYITQLIMDELTKISPNTQCYAYKNDDTTERIRIKETANHKQVGWLYLNKDEEVLTFNYQAFKTLPKEEQEGLLELAPRALQLKNTLLSA